MKYAAVLDWAIVNQRKTGWNSR